MRRMIAVSLLFPWVAGCAVEAAPEDPARSTEAPLYADVPNLWENANGTTRKQISVCWNNFDATHPEVHGWVQTAVSRTWSFVADVDFTGWGSCGTGGADVRIDVGDNLGPAVFGGLGQSMSGLRLNFLQGSNYCGFGFPGETYRTCMEFIGIHEFGHVLGFAHEQNQSDTPGSCTDAPQGSNGTENYGLWDLNSIMNYCDPAYAAFPALSPTDTAGVQHYYGIGRRYIAAGVANL